VTYVLVASDKFKGSLTAAAVGEAVSAGIRGVYPNTEVVVAPVADGGALAAAIAAGFQAVPVTASGPTREQVATRYARRGDRAVVELADVSGLSQLSRGLAPLTASSRGTGEVIAAALDAGCRQIVLGVGGSACKKSTTTRGSAGSAVVSVAAHRSVNSAQSAA
jgi:glycerate kinase